MIKLLNCKSTAIKTRLLELGHTKAFLLAQAALRAPPKVALQCITGHCYYQLSLFSLSFGPGGFVFATRGDVAMRSWQLLLFRSLSLSLFSVFGPGGLRAPPEVAVQCVAGHCYYRLSLFFLSSFFSIHN